jgi:streptogramin lyase
MMGFRSFAATVVAIALTACSVPNSSPRDALAPSGNARHRAGRGHITFRIRVPRKQHGHRGARYISVDTQAMSIAISGPSNETVTLGLTALASDCTTSLAEIVCTASLGLAPCVPAGNCYTAEISTYDEYDAANNSIPAGAKMLSTAQNVGFTIATGQSNALSFTLSGVPSQIDIVPATMTSVESHSAVTLEGPGSHLFYAQAIDADGNIITGFGAPSFSVAASGPLAVTLTQPSNGSRRFTVAPPSSYDFVDVTTLTVTASYPSGLTDGCAQSGAVCQASFLLNMRPLYDEFLLSPGSQPENIVLGSDGAYWFTEQSGSAIGRISTTGVVTEYQTLTPNSQPNAIVAGPDGNLWFTEQAANQIGKVSPNDAAIVEYGGLTASSGPAGITVGPDGNLWFTEYTGDRIGKITTTGIVSEYSGLTAAAEPSGITVGSDANLWFTEYGANKIGKMTTAGVVSEYAGSGDPLNIAPGPDGNLWFTEQVAERIGKMTTTGALTEYPLTNVSWNIAPGSNGNMLFTEEDGPRIGSITTSGVVSEFPVVPSLASGPRGIALAPNGVIWFTEWSISQIGRMQI